MQCSACGTQLPQGVAFCPTCGNITPDYVSSTEASPSDTTIASSAQSSQYSYAPPYPYDTPPIEPPPPPPHHRRLSVMSIALLIILVLIIVGAGGFLYFRTGVLFSQSRTQASPTTPRQVSVTSSPALQATATPSAQTPQNLYTQITQTSPALDDPLGSNNSNNWTETTSADGSCVFTEGAYHARAQQKNMYMLCVAQATNFSDLAYQIQMTIVKGEFGGMVFRTDISQSKYYSFFVDRSGTYTLITSVDNTGSNDRVLQKGTSAFIRTGLNQLNLLAVVARGSNIYLYINQQYITSASDSTYHAGQIGVL